jgi:hypothetical protein
MLDALGINPTASRQADLITLIESITSESIIVPQSLRQDLDHP